MSIKVNTTKSVQDNHPGEPSDIVIVGRWLSFKRPKQALTKCGQSQ